jgi:hypothetical protein
MYMHKTINMKDKRGLNFNKSHLKLKRGCMRMLVLTKLMEDK